MRLLDKIVMMVAVAAFVFVVVCPDIPPPNGVKDQSDSPGLHLRSITMMFVQAATPLNVTSSRGRTLTGDAILALTCARLC